MNLPNSRKLITKGNQLVFEKFDGTNVIKLGSFLDGIHCSIERIQSYVEHIPRTDEEILDWLFNAQEQDYEENTNSFRCC